MLIPIVMIGVFIVPDVFAESRMGTNFYARINAGCDGNPLWLREGDRKRPVLLMEPIKSDALQRFLPDYQVFRLVSSCDIIHYIQFSALVVNSRGVPSHLETNEHVFDFLSNFTQNVKSAADAKLLVRAFADLRSFKILEKPTPEDARVEPLKKVNPLPTDYKLVAKEFGKSWKVYATCATSVHWGRVHRFIFTLSPGSGIDIDETAWLQGVLAR